MSPYNLRSRSKNLERLHNNLRVNSALNVSLSTLTEEENFNNSEDESDDDTEDGNYENQRNDDESWYLSQSDNEAEDERDSENLPRASVSNSEKFVAKTKKSYFEWMKKPLDPGIQNLSTEASVNNINTISPEPTGAEKMPKCQ